mmetsp:Transcript_675/g.1480  ORF Transcript_675/g.1480 Transcript_675/m.1480 type:complete len:276 (+) Transcript_675:216-1043(+)
MPSKRMRSTSRHFRVRTIQETHGAEGVVLPPPPESYRVTASLLFSTDRVGIDSFGIDGLEKAIKMCRGDERHDQVAQNQQPKVEVAILPEQLGDSRAPSVIYKVHAVNAAQKLSWAEDGGDQSEHEEDVVQAIGLLGSQHLLIPQQLVLLLFGQPIVHLLDAHALFGKAAGVISCLFQVIHHIAEIAEHSFGEIFVGEQPPDDSLEAFGTAIHKSQLRADGCSLLARPIDPVRLAGILFEDLQPIAKSTHHITDFVGADIQHCMHKEVRPALSQP